MLTIIGDENLCHPAAEGQWEEIKFVNKGPDYKVVPTKLVQTIRIRACQDPVNWKSVTKIFGICTMFEE